MNFPFTGCLYPVLSASVINVAQMSDENKNSLEGNDPYQRKVTSCVSDELGFVIILECGHSLWWGSFPPPSIGCSECLCAQMLQRRSARSPAPAAPLPG